MNAPLNVAPTVAAVAGDNETTLPDGTQAPANDAPEQNHNENVISENSNKENSNIDAWKGDPRYFQTGQKAGTLKPSAREVGGQDNDNAIQSEFGGLDTSSIKATAGKNRAKQAQTEQAKAEVKQRTTKAEKRATEAKIASALVMRALDVSVDWISGGEYGAKFTPEQVAHRMSYREALQSDWEAYLATLDLPMHPALVVIAGSVMYVAPAMQTEKAQSRLEKFKAKIFYWWTHKKGAPQ